MRSDIAPSGTGVVSWKALWSDCNSGASAPPPGDDGDDVFDASFPGPTMAVASAFSQREAASDPGSKRTTFARCRWTRDAGVGALSMTAFSSRDLCVTSPGRSRWCSRGYGHVTFRGRNSLGIAHRREMYHKRRGSSLLGSSDGATAASARPVAA